MDSANTARIQQVLQLFSYRSASLCSCCLEHIFHVLGMALTVFHFPSERLQTLSLAVLFHILGFRDV